ncbi:MAG: GNAT family N-acetyltransferase [Anaeroplasmataceae bacterium]
MATSLPTIKNNRYILRDISIRDYMDLFEFGSDFENTKYVTWGPYQMPEEAYNSINLMIMDRIKQGLPVGYAIVCPKTKKMIGMIDFHTYYPNTNCAEVGFILHKAYWNRGIMTSALKDLIRVGFEKIGFNKILIGHIDINLACQKVIEKCDFKYESRKYNAILDKLTYEPRDIIYYSLYKEDYERGILKWQ